MVYRSKRGKKLHWACDKYRWEKYDRYEINPVIKPELEFEKKSVMNPCVMYDEHSNMFKMWYAAGESYEPDVIAYAESTDGIHWKKNPMPVMSSNAEFLYQKAKVGACDVVRMKDGQYCMVYIAYQNINVARICLAYSNDGISNWIYSKATQFLVQNEESGIVMQCINLQLYLMKKTINFYCGTTDEQIIASK